MGFGSLPAYQVPNGLNFQPVANALSDVARSNQDYARMDLDAQRLGMERQTLDLNRQRTDSELQTAGLTRQSMQQQIREQHIQALSPLLQNIMDEPDATTRAQKLERFYASDPSIKTDLKAAGIDVDNPQTVPGQVLAILHGDPVAYRAKQLANEKAQLDIDASKFQKVAPGEVPYTFQNGKWGPVGGPQQDIFTRAGYGPNGEAPGTWGQAAAPGGSAGATGAPPVPAQSDNSSGTSSAAPTARGAPPPAPIPSRQFQRMNYTGADYPQGLPQAGDPTALASGAAAPGAQTTPGYFSPEDVQRARLMSGASPREVSALMHTPGAVQRDNYARWQGKYSADVENTRKSLAPVLSMMEDIKRAAMEAGPDTLHMATGPNYGSDDPKSWNPLPNTSGGSYQAIRAFLNNMTLGAPDTVSTTFGSPRDSNAAYALNTKMQHLKKAVATLYKSVPGAGGKGGGTDQSQRELEDAIGEMMKTADPETFFSILHDATNTARGLGAYDPLPRSEKYSPWGADGKPIKQTEQLPSAGGFKYLGPAR